MQFTVSTIPEFPYYQFRKVHHFAVSCVLYNNNHNNRTYMYIPINHASSVSFVHILKSLHKMFVKTSFCLVMSLQSGLCAYTCTALV